MWEQISCYYLSYHLSFSVRHTLSKTSPWRKCWMAVLNCLLFMFTRQACDLIRGNLQMCWQLTQQPGTQKQQMQKTRLSKPSWLTNHTAHGHQPPQFMDTQRLLLGDWQDGTLLFTLFYLFTKQVLTFISIMVCRALVLLGSWWSWFLLWSSFKKRQNNILSSREDRNLTKQCVFLACKVCHATNMPAIFSSHYIINRIQQKREVFSMLSSAI